MGDNAVMVAWIGAGASLLGAVASWVRAHRVEKLKGEIATELEVTKSALAKNVGRDIERTKAKLAKEVGKELETTKAQLAKEVAADAAAQRVASERQLEVFKLAASSAEDAARRLLAWHERLREFDRETYTTKEALDLHRDDLTELRRAAEASGLFVAPDLDVPLATAHEALSAAVKAVSLVAIAHQHGHDVTVERLDDRSAKLKRADAAVADYAARARAWKAKEWKHESSNGDADGK